MTSISQQTISEAHERIKPYIHRTPVLTSSYFNQVTGASLYFKPENLQKIGAFKARGAINAALQLSEEQRSDGIVTHSSGNHAQGIAYAAKMLGIKGYVVMPDNSPRVKVEAVKGYGAEVIFCENTPEKRQETADRVKQETGAHFIHAYNDLQVIAGQATAVKELIEDAGTKFDILITPVGGGGLLSGSALSCAYFTPGTTMLAAEPEGAADAVLSLKSGQIERAPFVNTIADGLLTPLGDKTFPIIQKHVSDILTVSDEDIRRTMRLVWERMKIVVEPSGVVALATILAHPDVFAGKKVGVVFTGGNVDLDRFFNA